MKLSTLIEAQALRSHTPLEPIDGPNGRLFPPTYMADGREGGARHVIEVLPDNKKRALIDSIASQANRAEAALVAARDQGRINFSDVYVDLSGTEADMKMLSATQMPHRLSDAILRDSEISGVAFGRSEVGKRILGSSPADLSVILETSPTTIVYGCWFSQHKLAQPLKLQRIVASEIWADDIVEGKAVGSRIDPLGIEKFNLYEAADGEWTPFPDKAVVVKGKPKLFALDSPSKINHGNIPPDIRNQGVTVGSVTLRWALSLAAARRLRFGGGARDGAGQAYVVALGLLGRVLDHEAGYALRSRCDLISTGPVVLDIIDRNGAVTQHEITPKTALDLLHQAEVGLRNAGIALHQRTDAKPGQRLIDLIAANKRRPEKDGPAEAAA